MNIERTTLRNISTWIYKEQRWKIWAHEHTKNNREGYWHMNTQKTTTRRYMYICPLIYNQSNSAYCANFCVDSLNSCFPLRSFFTTSYTMAFLITSQPFGQIIWYFITGSYPEHTHHRCFCVKSYSAGHNFVKRCIFINIFLSVQSVGIIASLYGFFTNGR